MTIVEVQDSKGKLIKSVDVDSTKPLLSQLEAEGIEIANACRTGMCAACMCHIHDDARAVKNLRGEPAFPLGEGEIMTCIGGVSEGEKVILKTMD